ncbi:MAG: hypothetical protein O3C43_03055 [Verrucomicrobia bacterium]|nr:hypothetical protein [Verrucomicrobiota bacterium]MDA1065462.1 hypothetical protein [Verrucomicrobiota bacterium]
MKVFPKLIGIIVLLILVILSLIDASSVNITSNWVRFLGRFHPVLLHLPIGIFAGVVLLELYLFFQPVSRAPEKIRFLLRASFIATAFSALFGVFLSWEGGYDGSAIYYHKWAGILTAGFLLVLDWTVGDREAGPGKIPIPYIATLVLTIIAITITGHKGGSLTHGSDYLTQYSPFAKEVPVVEITENTSVYISHIQPIFEDYCFQCHSSEKIKGEFRLDSFEMLMAGGVNGDALVPGDSEASSLIHRIHLLPDNEEHMPPDGKPQPSDEIVSLVSWWIDQGASATATLKELEVTPEIAVHFLKVDVLEFLALDEITLAMESLESHPSLSVYLLAQEDNRVGVRSNQAMDEDIASLLSLKPNLVELNLSRSSITDVSLEAIGQMTNLTHLHLNNTAVTDAGIAHLVNLYQLEYINLYGTNITDASVEHLRQLKNLKKVFFWETAVTKEAVVSLHKSIFAAVESDKMRLQIQALEKRRDSLEVDIVSAFDFEEQDAPVVTTVEEPGVSISDVMIEFHKGKNSLAVQAQEGLAEKDALLVMLKQYQAIMELTPPKGSAEDWKKRMSELVESTNELILSGGDEAGARYKEAVNCKSCHTEHRTE